MSRAWSATNRLSREFSRSKSLSRLSSSTGIVPYRPTPMIKSMLADRDLLARCCNALTFGLQAFDFSEFRDDLFGRVSCYFHLKSLSAFSARSR